MILSRELGHIEVVLGKVEAMKAMEVLWDWKPFLLMAALALYSIEVRVDENLGRPLTVLPLEAVVVDETWL